MWRTTSALVTAVHGAPRPLGLSTVYSALGFLTTCRAGMGPGSWEGGLEGGGFEGDGGGGTWE